MYVRFKVTDSSSSNWYGFKGVQNALETIATATAGSTPAKPTGVDQWYVIGNTEAGGWTVESKDTATGTGTYGHITIKSNTPKTNYVKKFKIDSVGTDYDRAGYLKPTGLWSRDGGSSNDYDTPLQYSNTTSTSNNHNLFYNTTGVVADANRWWHISCTENYIWFWFTDMSNQANAANNFCGMADLNGVPDVYLEGANSYFPAVGFYSASNNSTNAFGTSSTGNYYDYFAHSSSGMYSSSDDYARHVYNASNVQYTATSTTPSNSANQPLGMGPPYYYNNTGSYNAAQTYKPLFDGNGNYSPSLTPVYYFNPFYNIPMTTLHGFKYYEDHFRIDDSHKLHQHGQEIQDKIIYDESGDRYVLQTQYNQYGVRAFRAV